MTLVFRDDEGGGFVRETVRFARMEDAAEFQFARVCELQARSRERR